MRSSPENSAGKNWGWNMMDCGTTKPVQTQNTNSSRIPPSRLLWWTGSWCVLFCCFFRPRRKIFPRIGFKMFQENSAGNNDNLEGYCTLIYCTLFCGTTYSHYFTVHVDPLPLHIFGDPWHLPAQSRTTKSFCRSGVSLAKLFDILQFMCTQSYIYIYIHVYICETKSCFQSLGKIESDHCWSSPRKRNTVCESMWDVLVYLVVRRGFSMMP